MSFVWIETFVSLQLRGRKTTHSLRFELVNIFINPLNPIVNTGMFTIYGTLHDYGDTRFCIQNIVRPLVSVHSLIQMNELG